MGAGAAAAADITIETITTIPKETTIPPITITAQEDLSAEIMK
jgi:hypothetical protein